MAGNSVSGAEDAGADHDYLACQRCSMMESLVQGDMLQDDISLPTFQGFGGAQMGAVSPSPGVCYIVACLLALESEPQRRNVGENPRNTTRSRGLCGFQVPCLGGRGGIVHFLMPKLMTASTRRLS